MIDDLQLLDAWRHTLSLSALKPGEQVVILNGWDRPARYKAVAAQAVRALGAAVSYVEIADPDRLPAGVLPLLAAADLVIDLVFVHDPALHAVRRQDGTRVLLVLEPPEVLERLRPSPADKLRTRDAEARLRGARVVRVTSAAGTDFSFAIGDYPVSSQYGYADEPGHWDQWPGTFAYTFANDGAGAGRVVIDRGDILFPFNQYVAEPITLEIADGWITSITGGFHADMMRSHMASFGSRDVYALSHLGWGLSPNARWEMLGLYPPGALEGQDGRAFAGNFLFSTGPNDIGGGTRSTPCHIDAPMRACSVLLDGRPVVEHGALVADPALAAE
jgi:2,5-dihydroxypyridine 5,6-dioxygenase